MKILMLVLAGALFLAACGKKAPLRPPPDDPPEQAEAR